ncbi:MAG: SIMPL domain-containing protein [Caldimonas sp.]
MKSSIKRLRVVAICLVAWPVIASAQGVVQGVVGLSASASVEVTRDLLSITFSTARDGADANAVQAQLKQALDAALAEAKKISRPGQVDVQTGAFSLFPRYAASGSAGSGRQTLNGWQGSAEVIVEGRDMAAIGQLVGRITTMTVARVGYRLSREASQRVEADIAAEAIAKYRAKAAEYAKQFGFAGYVIREVNISADAAGPQPLQMARMTASAMKAPGEALAVEPGKETVTASVNGTVQLK